MSFASVLRRMVFCRDTIPLTIMLSGALSLGVYSGIRILAKSPEVILDRDRRKDKIGEAPAFEQLADAYEHRSLMRAAAEKSGKTSVFPNKV